MSGTPRTPLTRSVLIGTAALALALTGCSATPTASKGGGSDSLTVNLGFAGTTINRNFNPFSLKATQGTFGFQYESLFGFNILQGGKFVPWLATAYDWSDGGKKITLHLDPRANWSDGSKLTAADVVFTVDYIRDQKLQPSSGTFAYKKATAVDAHTVEITFAKPAYSKLNVIGGLTPVPAKLWKGKNGATYTNLDPVGSGAYTLRQYSAQQLTFEARDDYWKQKDVPVKTVKAPVVAGSSEIGKLLRGDIQWSGGAIADVKKQYVSADPENHHAWYPTYGGLFMFFNHTKAPFDDVHVRKGLSLAVDRSELARLGNPGMFNDLNLTGLDTKTQGKWVDAQYADADQPKPEPAAAYKEFEKSGYQKKGGRLVGPDGKQLSFTIIEVSDFGDSIQRDKVLAEQLKKAGVKVDVQALPSGQVDQRRREAKFDVVVGGAVYGNTPFSFFQDMLASKNAGVWCNYGHYKSKKVDALLADLEGSGDEATIKKTSAELQKVMVDDVPAAPLITIGASAEYNSEHWTGWPDEQNPYANPAPWSGTTNAMSILLNLRPANGK
ncbi:ABC transporter substrate-binding protein [Streptomyces longispororuber]|uniref:ABC transporter substrate-binding protein n=1 Tax=Streptomyces longispororuber TaxID=68230 RepID=UPI00210AEF8D|nr:ABC transporter substrate-binding protein [Streptomyces longispororuber]MCQ4211996.1 ABC transporter substrate-binding protein [Streptomyces longispororuber]